MNRSDVEELRVGARAVGNAGRVSQVVGRQAVELVTDRVLALGRRRLVVHESSAGMTSGQQTA
jgi:hypothetical protein